jgi:hypothetical protein
MCVSDPISHRHIGYGLRRHAETGRGSKAERPQLMRGSSGSLTLSPERGIRKNR